MFKHNAGKTVVGVQMLMWAEQIEATADRHTAATPIGLNVSIVPACSAGHHRYASPAQLCSEWLNN